MVMQEPIRERVEKLREEIAQINAANRLHLQGGKKLPGAADHRITNADLQQILDELAALTDWKKV